MRANASRARLRVQKRQRPRREWLVLAEPSQERALARRSANHQEMMIITSIQGWENEPATERRRTAGGAASRAANLLSARRTVLLVRPADGATRGSLSDLPDNLMTADHVIPYRNGGRARAGNIVAACASCNSSRDRAPRGGRYTTGNNTPSSPFEVLQARESSVDGPKPPQAPLAFSIAHEPLYTQPCFRSWKCRRQTSVRIRGHSGPSSSCSFAHRGTVPQSASICATTPPQRRSTASSPRSGPGRGALRVGIRHRSAKRRFRRVPELKKEISAGRD